LKTLGIDPMTREALACGAENRFFPGPLRRACQLCERPVPIGADLTIGIFGTSSEQSLFIIPKDETTDARLELAYSTDGFATQTEGSGRESAVKAILAASAARRDDLSGDEQGRPGNISSLLVSFARCSLCADCLDACPLYEGELSGMLSVGTLRQREQPVLAELIGISRWLASCSGCGMCEEVCEWDIPLTLLMARLSQYIHQELHYVAGEPGQNLPWAPVECRESWR
jgi:ferredoxin